MSEEIADKIVRRIRAEGPLTVAAYMAMALHDPEGGYYARRGPIGAAGDFTTAPEISQIFGELIGLWCAEFWERIGRPDPVILAELGPGRGVLMRDLLRAAGTVPEFRCALRIFLVETSPVLRAEQEGRLSQATAEMGDAYRGAARGADADGGQRVPRRAADPAVRPRPGGWSERMVTVDPEDQPGLCRWSREPCGEPVSAGQAASKLARHGRGDLPGRPCLGGRARLSIGPPTGCCTVHRLRVFPDCARTDAARVQRHRPVSALAAPGTADLSAHVDFAAFAEAARAAGAEVHGPISQGRFLTALGAGLRLEALSARATPAQRQSLESGVRRLLDPAEMGDLFKVMALVSPGLASPAGFGPSFSTGEPAPQ